MFLIAYLLAAIPAVVVPDVPTSVEKFAAEELACELGKCLGETPEIVREGECIHAPRLYVGATKAAKAARREAVEKWIRDVKSFGVKARRETTSASEIEDYFRRLREGGKP